MHMEAQVQAPITAELGDEDLIGSVTTDTGEAGADDLLGLALKKAAEAAEAAKSASGQSVLVNAILW